MTVITEYSDESVAQYVATHLVDAGAISLYDLRSTQDPMLAEAIRQAVQSAAQLSATATQIQRE